MSDNRIDNNLTRADIKASGQYKWRSSQIKISLLLWAILSFFALIVGLFAGLSQESTDSSHYLQVTLRTFGAMIVFYGLIIVPFIVFYVVRRRQLLEKYASLPLYTIILDNPHTSYLYRYSVYFSAKLIDGNKCVTADTYPLFSSSIFSILSLEDYSNKKVRALYDEEDDKLYVIDLA